MSKPNVLVKVSGDLIGNTMLNEWIEELTRSNSVVVIVGGGHQINNHFRKCQGHVQQFGPMGREINNFHDRQAARAILEENQAVYQDYFDRYHIPVRVAVPVFMAGDVLCHVNGDMYALLSYNGFDEIYVVTLPERVVEKERYFSAVAHSIGKGILGKIHIKSFEAQKQATGT
jgi:hypothetical protein